MLKEVIFNMKEVLKWTSTISPSLTHTHYLAILFPVRCLFTSNAGLVSFIVGVIIIIMIYFLSQTLASEILHLFCVTSRRFVVKK